MTGATVDLMPQVALAVGVLRRVAGVRGTVEDQRRSMNRPGDVPHAPVRTENSISLGAECNQLGQTRNWVIHPKDLAAASASTCTVQDSLDG